jgi:hypothetical protein
MVGADFDSDRDIIIVSVHTIPISNNCKAVYFHP